MPDSILSERAVRIVAGGATLHGDLAVAATAHGVVLFVHGSGSSRHSPRNRFVAEALRAAGLGTLLMDLLTEAEEQTDIVTREYRFDIDLLADRVAAAAEWLAKELQSRPDGGRSGGLGLFGASTGAAAALICAAKRPELVRAVVSRGGRPDLAGGMLRHVASPTLLIVGGRDDVVIELNRRALDEMTCEKQLEIIPGATHLFEEPGTLDEVARLAADWFRAHFDITT